MKLIDILSLFGGIGMFLYGMRVMSEGLESTAGGRLKTIIAKMTGNILLGVLMGTVVTAVIQSSSATTVMVVGFVNSGLMTLRQSVGVIAGANIGTVMTAWILSLNAIPEETAALLQYFKPRGLAPIAIVIAIVIFFCTKNSRTKDKAQILMGFGLLFTGVLSMEASVSILKDIPAVQQFMISFENPFLGILAGTGVTAVIQSSSASVGILQQFADQGLVTFAMALPIIMGQNIGTCVTAILSSISANRGAKRAAMLHLSFNIFGTVLFTSAYLIGRSFLSQALLESRITSVSVATIHTVFNITTTVLVLPFAGLMVRLSEWLIPDKKAVQGYALLDERFLNTPTIAIAQAGKVAVNMSQLALENMRLSRRAVLDQELSVISHMEQNENDIDVLENELGKYLIRITDRDLSESESRGVTGLFHTIGDYERIGDYIENIGEVAEEIRQKGITFSESAKNELGCIFDAVEEIIEITNDCYNRSDVKTAMLVEPLEEIIDQLKETLRDRHVSRLTSGECGIAAGIALLEIITNIERISDHCSSIAVHLVETNDETGNFDSRSYLRAAHQGTDETYMRTYGAYEEKYLARIV